MKKNVFTVLAVGALTLGLVSPSFAGVLKETAGLFAAPTAAVVDTPEGVVIDSVVRLPYKTSKYMATTFGDEHGFGQKVVGSTIGVPVGFLWGIPEGAIHGFHHGWVSGWDKPFSSESFVVSEGESK